MSRLQVRDRAFSAKRRNPLLTLLLILTAAGVLVAAKGCPSYDRWSRADEFVAQLRCGMNEAEIRALARQYRDLALHTLNRDPDGWNLAAWRKRTSILMKLDAGGLRHVRVSWTDTIMHRAELPELDLCKGTVPRQPEGSRNEQPQVRVETDGWPHG